MGPKSSNVSAHGVYFTFKSQPSPVIARNTLPRRKRKLFIKKFIINLTKSDFKEENP